MPRTTHRRQPPPWRRWTAAPNALTGPPTDTRPYAAVEAELQALRGPDALTGHAGKYALTLPSGVVVTVMADTDEESRIAMAIL